MRTLSHIANLKGTKGRPFNGAENCTQCHTLQIYYSHLACNDQVTLCSIDKTYESPILCKMILLLCKAFAVNGSVVHLSTQQYSGPTMVFICYYLSLSTMQCMHNLPMKAVVFHCRHQTALLQKKTRKIWQKYIKYSIYQTVSNRPTENWKRGLQHFLNRVEEKYAGHCIHNANYAI